MRLHQLGPKLALLFVSLFALLQVAQLVLVRQSVVETRQAVANRTLLAGERVFEHLLQQRAQSTQQLLQSLLADIHVKEILISQDAAAIRQTLIAIQRRSDAGIAEFRQADNRLQLNTANLPTRPLPKQTVQPLMVTRGDTAYQWVTAAVKAGDTRIGEVSIGLPLNDSVALEVKQLSQVDISFFKRAGRNPWQRVASTRDPRDYPLLQQWIQQVEASARGSAGSSGKLASRQDVVRMTRIHSAGDAQWMVVMQAPLGLTTEDLLSLFVQLVSIACLGVAACLLAVWWWHGHTLPVISSVTNELNTLADRGTAHPVLVQRQDELGALAQAYNQMRGAVQQRVTQLEQLCLQDPLTGLANQLGFIQALEQAIAARLPTLDKPGLLTLVLVNIQQFKALNALMGRPVADEVLRQTGQLLTRHLLQAHDVVARLDADMFAVLLLDTSQPDVAHYVEKVHGLFKQALHITTPAETATAQSVSQPLVIQIRTGIALYPAHGHTAESLLRHALLAVQSAKKQHTHRAIYHETMAIEMAEQQAMVTEINTAIAESQLLLYLQPIVELRTHQVLAAEALLRWAHPEKGMLFPEQFLPMIERTEGIHALTDWILANAYQWLAELHAQGIRLHLSVNITARDLTNHALPQQMLDLCARYQLPVDVLTLELTEQALMQDAERAETMVRQLAMAGIPLSIDQFGSAYSSLTALRRFTMHELKIDKAFVTYMHKNPADYAMTKSIIELAHNLGMFVVAEGVESEEVFHQLTQLGCQAGQGFFMAKPMPARDFPIWLARWQSEHQLDIDIGDDLSLSINPLEEMPDDPDAALQLSSREG